MESDAAFADMDCDCMESVTDIPCDTPFHRETAWDLSKKRNSSTDHSLVKPTATKHFILSKSPAASLFVGINGVNPEARLTQAGNETCFVLNIQELEKLTEWDFLVNSEVDLGYDDRQGGLCVREAIRNRDGLMFQHRLIPNRQPADEWEKRQCIWTQFQLNRHATVELRKIMRAALATAQMLQANKRVFVHMNEIIVQKIIALQEDMCRRQPIENVFEDLYRVMRVYTPPSFFVRQFLGLSLNTDLAISDVYDVCAAQVVHLRELASLAETSTEMLTDVSVGK